MCGVRGMCGRIVCVCTRMASVGARVRAYHMSEYVCTRMSAEEEAGEGGNSNTNVSQVMFVGPRVPVHPRI